ncbi:TonB-dependent receptor [Anthocerotibacter panamensis]|uniref:TonB-dependent receptor n=1 Tax=Anthocerotibacter panamensis TaxID=2857077 RepID=UPI001C4051DD|nr:TonB-dependent receptor [Anthocerotibacter panamensis]
MNRNPRLILLILGLTLATAGRGQAQSIPTKQDMMAQQGQASSQLLAQADKADDSSSDEVVDLLDEFTVTSSRRQVRLKDTPSSVYIVDRAELERKGANNVGEAIRGVAGVQSNLFGAGADVHGNFFIRGQPNIGIGILVDGRLITNLNQEHFDLADLPVYNVDRVEILTGSGSTLYGSNAIGGVVNVITHQPTGPLEGNVKAEFGSFGYSNYIASYGGKVDRLGYNFAYRQFDTNNDYEYEIQRPTGTFRGIRPNGYSNLRDYQVNLSYDLSDRSHLRLNSYIRNVNKGIAPFSILDPTRPLVDPKNGDQQFEVTRLTDKGYGVALTYDQELGSGKDSQLQFLLALDNNRVTEASATNPADLGTFTDISAFNLQIRHNWQLDPTNNITYGFDYIREFGSSGDSNPGGTFSFDAAAGRPGLFALYTWQPTDRLVLTAGVRETIPDPITARGLTRALAGSLDPSIGVRWQITPTLALRTNYQSVYRAPNFNDLFGRTTHIGNPFLEPQRGTSFDLGLDWQTGNTSLLRLTYFLTKTTNLVDYLLVRNSCAANGIAVDSPQCTEAYDNDPRTNAQRFRVGYPDVHTSGIEAAFNWQVTPEWNVFANATLVDARIIQAPDAGVVNGQLASIDALNGSGGLGEGLFKVDVNERNALIQTQYPLVPYATARLGVSYQQPSGFGVSLFANLSGQRSVDVNHVGPFDTLQAARLAPGSLLPGYTTLDLSTRIPLTPSVTFNGYIDNLLGTFYERSYGNAAPGFNFRGGLSYSF